MRFKNKIVKINLRNLFYTIHFYDFFLVATYTIVLIDVVHLECLLFEGGYHTYQ